MNEFKQQQQQSDENKPLHLIDFAKSRLFSDFMDFAKRNVCKLAKKVAKNLDLKLTQTVPDTLSYSEKHISFELIPVPNVFNFVSHVKFEDPSKVRIYTDMAMMDKGQGIFISHPSYHSVLLRGMKPDNFFGSFQNRPPPIPVKYIYNDNIRRAFNRTFYRQRPSSPEELKQDDIKLLTDERDTGYRNDSWLKPSYGDSIQRMKLTAIITFIAN